MTSLHFRRRLRTADLPGLCTLSLHDAFRSLAPNHPLIVRHPLTIALEIADGAGYVSRATHPTGGSGHSPLDRKSTRLNSSHVKISYAVFCLKKKNNHRTDLADLTLRPYVIN